MDIYNSTRELQDIEEYAMIVDDSMMIGSQKLLLTLGIPSQHKEKPLYQKDVFTLDMAVSSSWNSEGVKERLLAATNKMGYPPKYVISDNATIMTAGISKVALPHHRDISHSLGMFLERCYKGEEDFMAYTKSMSEAQAKHNMKRTAYLLPPRQRTIARFINLSNWVKWSRKMLNIYQGLTSEERTIFAFVPANASLIDELSEVMECIGSIEKMCKQDGLSKETIRQCVKKIGNTLFKGNLRMRNLGKAICQFLLEEGDIIENEKEAHNNSSDIIESTFGVYKRRKSPNKLYGVTSFILFIPMYTQLASRNKQKESLIKQHLQNIKLTQIHKWEKENLMPNLVTKRIKTLNMAG